MDRFKQFMLEFHSQDKNVKENKKNVLEKLKEYVKKRRRKAFQILQPKSTMETLYKILLTKKLEKIIIKIWKKV